MTASVAMAARLLRYGSGLAQVLGILLMAVGVNLITRDPPAALLSLECRGETMLNPPDSLQTAMGREHLSCQQQAGEPAGRRGLPWGGVLCALAGVCLIVGERRFDELWASSEQDLGRLQGSISKHRVKLWQVWGFWIAAVVLVAVAVSC